MKCELQFKSFICVNILDFKVARVIQTLGGAAGAVFPISLYALRIGVRELGRVDEFFRSN